eukprot:TRINITY_DN26598_c0_g1_i1.p1 TRINITY_DN26598_c0_g1~~TRINITY_DN26598_c0_g1_i1.p1  ORF type:complete len:623 (+),score=103.32 TRINITY_DN26598_c0_g1_i1:52-1920(+)
MRRTDGGNGPISRQARGPAVHAPAAAPAAPRGVSPPALGGVQRLDAPAALQVPAGTQLATRAESKIPISACGRTISLDASSTQTLLGLQEALQEKLQMQGQMFEVFDVNGDVLTTDSKLREAVYEKNLPLCATLTDASIHYIENRREELAQMQWKLVRDQLTGTSGKVAQLSRQAAETSSKLDELRSDMQAMIERSRMDIMKSFETEHQIFHTELKQLSERITAMGQLLNGERTKREIAVQAVEKQAQGLRDLIDAERAARRRDGAAHMSGLEDMRAHIECERASRVALEDRHASAIHAVGERVDEEGKHRADAFQDHAHDWRKAYDELVGDLQRSSGLTDRLRSEHELVVADVVARFSALESRCASIENRVTEAAQRQADMLGRLVERHERIAKSVDGMKMDDHRREGGMQQAMNKVRDLAETVSASEDEARELILRERGEREEQLRRTQQHMTLEHARQLADLETKIGEKVERDSQMRDRNVRNLVEEVAKRLEEPPAQEIIGSVITAAQGQVPATVSGATPIVPGRFQAPAFAFSSRPAVTLQQSLPLSNTNSRPSSAAPQRHSAGGSMSAAVAVQSPLAAPLAGPPLATIAGSPYLGAAPAHWSASSTSPTSMARRVR